jgi:hypothetical protein
MNPSPEDLTSLEDRNLASDHAIVHLRYAELHPNDQDAPESVSRLLRDASRMLN